MARPFSLGALLSFTPPAWLAPDDRSHGGDWWTGQYYVDLVQRLEKVGLDYVFFLDTLAVRRDKNGSMSDALKYAVTAPSHDPLPLVAMVAAATKHIGIVGTASTSFYPPYTLARLIATLDHISQGRIGWNIVTSFEQAEAQNYGMENLPPHDERYERAEEYVELVKELWNAWEPGSLVRDEATNTYVDATKVHSVDFEGKYYSSRGPLNVLRSPQGTPFLAQAGASERGRAFAAKNADFAFIPTDDGSIERLRGHRDDLRRQAQSFGREADDIQAIYPANLIFTREPWNTGDPLPASDLQIEAAVTWLSQSLDLDLTQFDLAAPFPVDTPPSGIRSMFDPLIEMSKQGMPLRDAVLAARYSAGDLNFFGTPEQIAQKLINFIDEVGGDGIILSFSYETNAEFLDNVTERLVPALRSAGVLRSEYVEGETLKQRFFRDRA